MSDLQGEKGLPTVRGNLCFLPENALVGTKGGNHQPHPSRREGV